MNIKTLQWNIGGGRICREGADPTLLSSYTENGLDAIIDLLGREQPDVITLQETHQSEGYCQTEIIADDIGYSYWVNDACDDSFIEKGQRIGQAVISRYPIIEKRFTPFTNPGFSFTDENGNEIASKNGGLTTCIIEFPDANLIQVETFHMTPFHFFGVDLESEQARNVLREVQSLIGKCQQSTIIQADFNLNFPSVSHLLQETIGFGIQEIIQEQTTTPGGKRLDHVLYAGMEVLTSEALRTVKTDHYPVLTRFQIKGVNKEEKVVTFTGSEPEHGDSAVAKSNPPIDAVGGAPITAESLGIKPIKEDTWKFFDKNKFDASPNSKLIPISKLILTKVHDIDPEVASGRKPHPVEKAYSYFSILNGGNKDPFVTPPQTFDGKC